MFSTVFAGAIGVPLAIRQSTGSDHDWDSDTR